MILIYNFIMKKINWSKIQKFYDEGHSWNDIKEKFGINNQTLSNASKKGIFKSRSRKESIKLYHKNNKKECSDDTKEKIRNSIKKTLKKNKNKNYIWSPFFKITKKNYLIKNDLPPLDRLEREIKRYGYRGCAKRYKVSDTTIKRWLKTLKENAAIDKYFI
jgi:DNA invertase Pin-like site-specific DNA recombinase